MNDFVDEMLKSLHLGTLEIALQHPVSIIESLLALSKYVDTHEKYATLGKILAKSVLGCYSLTGGLFNHLLCNITQSDHAHSLPHTKTNTWCDTTVQTLESRRAVDVLERVGYSHLLRSVRVILLRLHLDTNNLDGLVPGAETTTNGRSKDTFGRRKLLRCVGLSVEAANSVLTMEHMSASFSSAYSITVVSP